MAPQGFPTREGGRERGLDYFFFQKEISEFLVSVSKNTRRKGLSKNRDTPSGLDGPERVERNG